jgi:hypothetical protein
MPPANATTSFDATSSGWGCDRRRLVTIGAGTTSGPCEASSPESGLVALHGILFELRDPLDGSGSQLRRLACNRDLAGAFDVRNATIQRFNELTEFEDQDHAAGVGLIISHGLCSRARRARLVSGCLLSLVPLALLHRLWIRTRCAPDFRDHPAIGADGGYSLTQARCSCPPPRSTS